MQQIINNEEKDKIISEMRMAGLHYGHKKTRLCPKAKEFVDENHEGILMINLEETFRKLNLAMNFIKKIIMDNGNILFVATMPAAKSSIKELAEKYNFSYVNERWLGGTLTNFKTINQRINHLNDLLVKKASGDWEKYTKKERSVLEKELSKLEKKFEGLKQFNKLPNAIFIVDTGTHDLVVKEAVIMNIPIIGVLDTDDDPSLINYPIPANDSAKTSIEYILKKIEEAIKDSRKDVVSTKDTK